MEESREKTKTKKVNDIRYASNRKHFITFWVLSKDVNETRLLMKQFQISAGMLKIQFELQLVSEVCFMPHTKILISYVDSVMHSTERVTLILAALTATT